MHSALFARTMTALGVDASYAAHVDRVPAITLASLNALSYLALHRARLGELVGHLCSVEMTSSAPSKLYSTGLRRLGFDRDATRFYDEHVGQLSGVRDGIRSAVSPGVTPQQPGGGQPRPPHRTVDGDCLHGERRAGRLEPAAPYQLGADPLLIDANHGDQPPPDPPRRHVAKPGMPGWGGHRPDSWGATSIVPSSEVPRGSRIVDTIPLFR